jgi:hypothetical protein
VRTFSVLVVTAGRFIELTLRCIEVRPWTAEAMLAVSRVAAISRKIAWKCGLSLTMLLSESEKLACFSGWSSSCREIRSDVLGSDVAIGRIKASRLGAGSAGLNVK